MLANHWTTQCMAVASWPDNGTPVVMAPCDVNDVRQYWRWERMAASDDHIRSLQGALCLDKLEGNNTEGLQLQMWSCDEIQGNGNPFQDYHYEQLWHEL
ncbi:RICIN domain-containing protein [Streptomyces sp. RKAG293]|nr:RICIN domain-containing protein [Streptomyces sp. RKAG293]